MGVQYNDGRKVPMCAACQRNLAEAHRVQQDTRMRYVNHLYDSIEMSVGLPGVMPALPLVTQQTHKLASRSGSPTQAKGGLVSNDYFKHSAIAIPLTFRQRDF